MKNSGLTQNDFKAFKIHCENLKKRKKNNYRETHLNENRNAPSEIILTYYKMIHLNISKNNLFWGLLHFAFMVFAFITL